MDGSRFVIEASEVESMAREAGLTVLELLPTLVKPVQNLARPPISNFRVGVVGLGSDGRIFAGVNLEFLGVPLHHSVHAEQCLTANLAAHGVTRLIALAVSAAPCGHCRQFLQELRGSSAVQILITSDKDPTFRPLSSLLSNPFGPFDLLDDNTPLLLEPHHNGLSIPSLALCNGLNTKLCNGHRDPSETLDRELEIAALEAANLSYAPYSGCPSGAALVDGEGRIYKGWYMESAAYNPSLGPIQAALSAYVVAGCGEYDRIVGGVLVEKEAAVVRQEEVARILLKAIAPKCEIRVLHCVASTSNGWKRD
ncbi:Cytidine deaminase [Bertholletia excelsa]